MTMLRLIVALTAAAGVWTAVAGLPTGREWEEPENLAYGREERRSAFSSFDAIESALKVLPEASERTVSLDSATEWRFCWSKDPDSRPQGFQQPDYDVSTWPTITVPCSWQAYGANGKGGWGTAIYTNQSYPFKRDQPRVMSEPPTDWTAYAARNPVGSYRRDFSVPANFAGHDVFLKFDAVDSFFYLWVNGKYVGFSKDSRNPAEFKITDFLQPGRNTVALEVYRYSDGSYLEDQDMFRLSGIARSVWLLARPHHRVRDFQVTPRPVNRKQLDGDWALDIAAQCEGEVEIDASLWTLKGKRVRLRTEDGRLLVSSPRLWSAEEPNCYVLVLKALHRGDVQEYVSCLVGFRISEIRNGRYYFNNEKIKLRGVNRHETDPLYGHFVPRERQLEDVRLMKLANVNHVRNSHYPQDDYFYHLCDLYGIYVMDEANVESHGYYYGKDSLSHVKSWEKATVQRNVDMVRRNRNHPCVTMWSLGNEAGPGENFAAAAAAVRAIDDSRPLQYERDNSVVDMDSNQYPGVGWVRWKAADAKAQKPFYISEYAHNMCNAMGDLKDYQIAIESSDVILGAAIWDWVDQGLWMRTPDGKMVLAYGGDFGDKPHSGQFVMNGVVLSDRTPEPGYHEVARVFQPFDFSLSSEGDAIIVRNLNYFRDSSACDFKITLLADGSPAAARTVALDLGPREKTVYPFGELPSAATLASVRIEAVLRESEGLLPAGHVVAAGQFDFPQGKRPAPPAAGRQVDFDKERFEFSFGADSSVRFDRRSGALVSYRVDGRETLLAPMTLDAFRAPSSNEVGLGGRWTMAGLRNLVQSADSIGPVAANPDGSYTFTVVATVRGARKERLVNFGGNRIDTCRIEDAGETLRHDPHFSVAQQWTIFPGGAIACQSEIRSRGRLVELARIGYRLTLDRNYDQVEWLGAGPFENYRDRRSGAFAGCWSSPVAGMVEAYAKPQDTGNREGVYAVRLGGAQITGSLAFSTLGEPFAFSAIPYSPTELCLAMHPQELPPVAKTELGIFAATRGLGGASCGPGPQGHHVIRNNTAWRLDFVLVPNGRLEALSMQPAQLPPDVRTGDDIVPVVVSASSAEPGEGDAAHLIDGDLASIWHSQYGVTLTKYPHEVTVDLGRKVTADGLSVWQRQQGENGKVRNFRFEVSADGKHFLKVFEGEMSAQTAEQKFAFTPRSGVRYWRLTALSEHHGREFAALAEVRIHEVQPQSAAAPAAATGGAPSGDEQAARQARSVHLNYGGLVPGADEAQGFVTVREEQTNSYYMVCGFDSGYMGVQNAGGLHIGIFSVWDPVGNASDFAAKPDDVKEADRAQVLYAAPFLKVMRFGGEGTGAKTVFPLDWRVGEPVGFRIAVRADGKDRLVYTGWVKLREDWVKLAEIARPARGAKPQLGYLNSFVEDFWRNGKSRHLVRRADFTGFATRTAGDAGFTPVASAMFTADENTLMNIDAGPVPGGAYLCTGGDTVNGNLPLWKTLKF